LLRFPWVGIRKKLDEFGCGGDHWSPKIYCFLKIGRSTGGMPGDPLRVFPGKANGRETWIRMSGNRKDLCTGSLCRQAFTTRQTQPDEPVDGVEKLLSDRESAILQIANSFLDRRSQ